MKKITTLLLTISSLLFLLPAHSQCIIDGVVADPNDCNTEDQFFVHINFEYNNVGENGFTVTGNGMNHGTYAYENLPVEIGPLNGDCETEWEFVVTDVDFENCSDFTVLGAICCGTSEECSITELVVDPGDCNEEGNFFVHINFQYSNVGENGFSVMGNGMDHGDFNYEDLPIEIGPLAGDCETPWEFVVRDNDFEACQAVSELGEVCCENSGECSITNVIADPGACNAEDEFFVHINFDYVNVGELGFSVMGNGIDHGDFEYEALPIEIGPLPGNCETPWEFIVIDNQFEACSDFVDLGPICCGIECDISELSVVIGEECNEAGEYPVTINFEHQGTSGVGFDLFTNGEFFGFYSYDELPLTIEFPGSGDPFDEITVCDNDNEACCASIAFASPCACNIEDIVIIPSDCNEEGQFNVTINFEYSNTSEWFTVGGNGMNHGEYMYSDLPIIIGPLNGDGETEWEFVVVDSESELCFNFGELGIVDCSTSEECSITDLIVEAHECDEEGMFLVDLDFNYQNVGDHGFVVNVNEVEYGPFEYENLFITLGPFDSNCDEGLIFYVNDVDFPDCEATYTMEPVCCEECTECEISELTVDPIECTGEGVYSLLVNFAHCNTSELGFDVWSGDIYVGFYHYEDLPITIEEFPEHPDSELDLITICDNDSETCCASLEFEGLNCSDGGNVCEIGELNIDIGECNDDNAFIAHINFEYANVGDEGFSVLGNGMDYGDFEYENLPIAIGPLSGDCETIYEFLVIDNQFENCASDGAIDPVCCAGECDITEISVDPGECTGDGLFSIVLDVGVENNNSDLFDVYSGDTYVGTYAYSDLPVTIEEFPERVDSEYDIITVCDSDSEVCCGTLEFMGPDCSEGNNCEIGELNIDPTECNDSNEFSVFINFEYANVGDNGFSVLGNGMDYGDFEYENLPIELGPFQGGCDSGYEFVVIDNDFEDCASDGFIEGVCCEGECDIFDLVIDTGECTGDGLFLLILNFEYQNVNSDLFDVYSGDEYIGTYAYAELPITIEEFPERVDSEYDIITVCDSDSETCCETVEFMGPDCSEGNEICEIGELNIDPTGCNDNNEFFVLLNFEYVNVGESGFSVLGNGMDYGDFEYENLPIELGPFEGGCETGYEFVVIDNDFEDCASDGFIENVCCEGECNIFDIVIETGECTGDGLFLLVLNFEYENVNSDFFDVYSGDEFIGTFAYAELPVTIEEFPERVDSDYDIITVCDSDSETCCETIEFMGPDCSEGNENCEIGELNIDPSECNDNNEFSVHINFEYVNVGDSGFSVVGNGMDYGDFEYADLPIEIGPLQGGCETGYEFIVFDNDFEDCASEGFVENICCEGVCEIGELIIDVGECNDMNQFFVSIDFDYANVGDNGFTVMGNGMDYGEFNYEELPIEIGPLEGDCETIYEFVVRDVDFEDCASDAAIDPVCCFEEAMITNVEVDPIECTGENTYSLFLDFDHFNTSESGFEVHSDGQFVGFYPYESLPAFIEEFPGRPGEFDLITICDNDSEGFCTSLEFIGLTCNETSSLGDLETSNMNFANDLLNKQVKLTFNQKVTSKVKASIVAISGQVIETINLDRGSQTLSFDHSQLPAGLYVLILQSEQHIANFKFVSL